MMTVCVHCSKPWTCSASGLVPVTMGDGSVIMITLEGLGQKIRTPSGSSNPVLNRRRQQPPASGAFDNMDSVSGSDTLLPGRRSSLLKSGRQIFTCQYCRHSYHAINSLKRHIKQVHFNNPTYTCELCGLGFMYRDHYTGHMNKHYGTPTFECDKCGQKYIYKPDLYKHKKSCDGTGLPPRKSRQAKSSDATEWAQPVTFC